MTDWDPKRCVKQSKTQRVLNLIHIVKSATQVRLHDKSESKERKKNENENKAHPNMHSSFFTRRKPAKMTAWIKNVFYDDVFN